MTATLDNGTPVGKPPLYSPFFDTSGNINPVWQRWLIRLWQVLLSLQGVGGNAVFEIDASVNPVVITPPAVPTGGELLTYFILQGNPITWGSIAGSNFQHPPKVPLNAGLFSVAVFVGRADGDWWTFPLLNVHP